MKRLILSCILALYSCFCYAQDKEAIIKVLTTQREAWNRGDIEGFMQGYWKSDSLMFVGKTEPFMAGKVRSTVTKKPIPVRPAWVSLLLISYR